MEHSEEDRYILINHEEAPILSDEKTQTHESIGSGIERRNSTIETKVNQAIPTIPMIKSSNFSNWDENLRHREEIL